MPAITPEYKKAIYDALVELGGEGDTVRILEMAKASSPEIDFGGSGDVVRGLRKLEEEKKLGFVCRITISHGGAGRSKKGDSSRNFWRLAGMRPGKEVEEERRFFIRCTAGELQEVLEDARPEKGETDEIQIFSNSPPV